MPEQFQVQTHGVGVEVVLCNSTVLRGRVFLHDAAEGHLGEEKVEDLLNSGDAFFPIAESVREKGAVLVNKNQALFVRVPYVPGKQTRQQDGDGPTSWAVKVTLELQQGAPLQGVLYFAQPPGRDRTLDGLNEETQFLCLVQDTAFCYVRRDAVVTVKEMGPQFASIPPAAP